MQTGFELVILIGREDSIAFDNIIYRNIDLGDDFDIDLTYQISEVEDIAQRSSSYSKNFTVPDTKNNRYVFNHISVDGVNTLDGYDAVTTNSTSVPGVTFQNFTSIFTPFIPKYKTKCILYYNSYIIFEGYLQMKTITKGEEVDGYEIVIYSDEQDFYSAIRDFNLADMDWSDMNHVYDAKGITSSWVNNNSGTQVYYPLIDYNNKWDLTDLKGIFVPTLPNPTIIDLKVQNFFPATPVYHTLKKMFLGAGFTWKSNFLESEEFKNLYIPLNNVPMLRGEYDRDLYARTGEIVKFKDFREFHVGKKSDEVRIPTLVSTSPVNKYRYNGSFLFDNHGPYPTVSGATGTDPYYDYYQRATDDLTVAGDPRTFFKNVATDAVYKSRFNVNLEFKGIPTNGSGGYLAIQLFREFIPSTGNVHPGWAAGFGYGLPVFGDTGKGITAGTTAAGTSATGYIYLTGYTGITQSYTTKPGTNVPDENITYVGTSTIQLSFNTDWLDGTDVDHTPLYPNERVRVQISFEKTGTTPGNASLTLSKDSNIKNEVSLDVIKGGQIDYYNIIPKNVKLTDFFSSICKMFNLYVEAVKGEYNTLLIEPRDDFYNSGKVEDWSEFVDMAEDIEYGLLVNPDDKFIEFKHKEDKDYYNTYFKDSQGYIYGSYTYNTNNDFASGTKKVETIFSPTPLTQLYSNSQPNTRVVLPQIWKEKGLSESTLGKISQSAMDSNIRIMYRSNQTVPFLPKSNDYMSFEGVEYNSYPYIGDVNDPYNPTRTINWGTPNGLYYNTEQYTDNNLVNLYYLNQLKEYTNNDSRLVKMRMILPANIIRDFSFTKNILVELRRPNHIGSGFYYKVSKISGYSPTDGMCNVELIRSLYAFQPKFNSITIRNQGPIDTTPTQGPGGGSSQFRTAPANTSPASSVPSNSSGLLSTNNSNNVTGTGVVATGYINNIAASNVVTVGSNNTISQGADNSIISGNNNNVYSSAFVMGSNNTVNPGLSNVLIFGDNIIAQQSNIIYTTNPTVQYINFISAGRDEVFPAFNANNINFISAGRDEVLPLFSDSVINFISSGRDTIL